MLRDGWLTEGRMIKINYKKAGITTPIVPETSSCHNGEILDATSDKGVLLGDSDGSVFCSNVAYDGPPFNGSGFCTIACHGYGENNIQEIDRVPLSLTYPE